MERVKVTVVNPFMYNGTMLKIGDVVDMNDERAANHMRAGDLKRDEKVIDEIKARRLGAAKAAQADAEGEW